MLSRQEANMQKTLACVAMLLAGALAGCSKDKHKEPATAGYDTQPRGHSIPTQVARAEPTEIEEQVGVETEWPEEPGMTPAAGTTEGMTPAAGTEDFAEPSAAEGLASGGPVILQYEGANYLAQALCKHEKECGRIGATDAWCEEVVKSQVLEPLGTCEQGLSRSELRECVNAIDRDGCDVELDEAKAMEECSTDSLCAD
jgi:hypothetical protein